MAVYDDIIFSVAKEADKHLAEKLQADVLYYNGPVSMQCFSWFRETVEKMASCADKKAGIAVFLTTGGGQAEAAEKFVDILRHNYGEVYFVVPVAAMSAGTILCMAGDKIYMDYSSSLGPIDPQIPDKEGKRYIPALGYLAKIDELIAKANKGNLTAPEFQWLLQQDLGFLSFCEEGRALAVDLLKKWLVKYKFKNWVCHRTHNKGEAVSEAEKKNRAEEIATLLSDHAHWHSHGRMIGLDILRGECCLEIDDYGADKELQGYIRRYNDTLSDYVARMQAPAFIYAVKAA